MSRLLFVAIIGAVAACHHTHFDRFDQTNLVSDQAGVGAITDPGLINAWGIAVDGGDQVFIAANGTGEISSYDSVLHVAPGFPVVDADASPITGLAVNTTSGFVITGDLGTGPAELLTVSEDGKVFAYSAQATSAPMVIVDLSSTNASFKGATIAVTVGVPTLLVTDFANNRVIEVSSDLTVSSSAAAAGAFIDPLVPTSYGPFGIQALGSAVYVTFAEHGQGIDEVDGPGLGMVDAFTFDGNLVQRMAMGVELDAPWGLALAPEGYDDFGAALMVGNFGDGTIRAFDPLNGDFIGTVEDPNGNALVVPGIWGLAFGSAGDDQTLYFAAGPDDEAHGLFGKLTIAP